MNKILLKNNWERYAAHIELSQDQIQQLVDPWCTDPVRSFHYMNDGCANSNIKVTFTHDRAPVVLRIYLREHSALTREHAIHQLVKEAIAVPEFLYSDSTCELTDFPYAITTFCEGSLMRELILSGDNDVIASCAAIAGQTAHALRQFTFTQGGFFCDPNLQIRPFTENEKFVPFLMHLLSTDEVKEALSRQMRDKLLKTIESSKDIIPAEDPAYLTHGDFDPANMLVKKVGHEYQLSALLDWEFSFSGPWQLDVGMFLRYAHRLPDCFQTSFLQEIKADDVNLVTAQARALDLICLLNLLFYNSKEDRPNLHSDVVHLIEGYL